MGDPRKIRKKYETPIHPWQKSRIVEEIKLVKEYGLKNKKELWKFSSFLKKYKDQAKKLIAMQGKQADVERAQMMDKLKSLALISPGNETYDAIFSLQLKDVLDRMLQTVLYKKGLARSIKQARQFIIHRHVMIGDHKITTPRYLVSVKEESSIIFTVSSSLFSEDHPERQKPDNKKKAELKEKAEVSEKKSVSKPKEKTNIKKSDDKKSETKEETKKEVKQDQVKESKVEEKVSEKEVKKEEAKKSETKEEVKQDQVKESKVEEKVSEKEVKEDKKQ